MKTLAIDIETYSSVDLKSGGVYPYASASDFEILLFAYAFDDEPVQIIDLARGEELPLEVMLALEDPTIIKTAYNAAFERICLSGFMPRQQLRYLPPEHWFCTMAHALTLGFPGSLDGVSKALKLAEDKAKLSTGTFLIRYFCMPCKPTKTNGGRMRNLPRHNPEKWEDFKEYCKRDVEAERIIREKLAKFPMPDAEKKLWVLDQQINDNGVLVDRQLVRNAIICDAAHSKKLLAEAVDLTGLDNPNSVAQLKKWLAGTIGLEIESLNKESVSLLLEQTENEKVKKVLELRQEMSKTSLKKYEAMEKAVCGDDRVRGLFQYYGANRTGRFAGRLVQVQNLPKNTMPDLDLARRLLKEGEYDLLEILFNSVPNTLSQLIRTAFIPEEGKRFMAADFSAIEARVIAWLAGEKWRLEVFKNHGKIYEASASQMFKVPIESITKASPLRQKGKVAELALGYQGGPGALIAMGALKQGLTEEELPELVAAWRKANPAIVKLWRAAEEAALKAVSEKNTVPFAKNMAFIYAPGLLFIKLPSGRKLSYVRPKIEAGGNYGREFLTYEGVNQETKQWGRTATYGGKIVENIVQAIARDCLREALFKVAEADYKIVMHVHDEAVIEAPYGFGSVEHVCRLMSEPVAWAPGLPLNAAGFETDYYKKE